MTLLITESLRGQLENVDIARKTATDQAENNKKLVEGKPPTHYNKPFTIDIRHSRYLRGQAGQFGEEM